MNHRFVDIHTHANFAAFDRDREEVIQRARDARVAMINVGTQKDTSASAVALAEQYEGVYAAVGLHPIHTSSSFHDSDELGAGGSPPAGGFTSRGEKFDYDYYKKLALHPKVVAIGECGLDYYRMENGKERQEANFRKQIELAIEVKKPLMLHIRNAYADVFNILRTYKGVRGNLHFFAGTVHDAKKFLDLGYSFSFTGVITFARNYDEVVRYLPLPRIMSETDAPFVAPAPYRGKCNEPAYVVEVVKKIAEIRGGKFEKVRAQLVENARSFFNLA